MKRTLATLVCTLAWIAAPAAQQPQPPGQPVQVQAPVFAPDQDANQTRQQLSELLREYPPSLNRVLALDPSLLSNQGYLATYPKLAAFLAMHPEVAHNPSFFVGTAGFDERAVTPELEAVRAWRDAMNVLMVVTIIATIAAFLGWLLKTYLDQRRWTQVSRTQTEAHNKLLDRLTSHEDLLAYIQTPVGRRFLEAAPILEEAPRAIHAPIGRVLWSAQIGVVVLFGGLGLRLAASQLATGVTEPLKLIGELGVAVGLGFIVSAAAAYVLSRRFGLLETRTNA